MEGPARRSLIKDECLTVLSVSPFEEDHERLRGIIGSVAKVVDAQNFYSGKRLLESQNFFLVICERDSPPSWTVWLDHIQSVPNPPLLIVTSRVADERLWAEVLNLGGWDVLAKPFDDHEVLRTVRSTMERYRSSGRAIGKAVSLTAAS